MPVPIHDGDGVRENGTPFGPECKGCWVIHLHVLEDHVVGDVRVILEKQPQSFQQALRAMQEAVIPLISHLKHDLVIRAIKSRVIPPQINAVVLSVVHR